MQIMNQPLTCVVYSLRSSGRHMSPYLVVTPLFRHLAPLYPSTHLQPLRCICTSQPPLPQANHREKNNPLTWLHIQVNIVIRNQYEYISTTRNVASKRQLSSSSTAHVLDAHNSTFESPETQNCFQACVRTKEHHTESSLGLGLHSGSWQLCYYLMSVLEFPKTWNQSNCRRMKRIKTVEPLFLNHEYEWSHSMQRQEQKNP